MPRVNLGTPTPAQQRAVMNKIAKVISRTQLVIAVPDNLL